MENYDNSYHNKHLKGYSENNLYSKQAVNNLQSIKVSDVFKNIYNKKAGMALKNLQKENNLLKIVNHNSSIQSNNSMDSFTGSMKKINSMDSFTGSMKKNNSAVELIQYPPKNDQLNPKLAEKQSMQSMELAKEFLNKMKIEKLDKVDKIDRKELSPIRENSPDILKNKMNLGVAEEKRVPRLTQRMNRSQSLIGANETNKSIKTVSKDSNLFNKAEDKLFMTTRTEFRKSAENIGNNMVMEKEKLMNEIGNQAVQKFMEKSENKKFYCPYCEHCNVLKEEQMEKYIFSIKEAKNIVNKAFEFITTSDLILGNELNLFKHTKADHPHEDKNISDKKDIVNKM